MVEVKRSAELEEMAREARRRFRAGDDAWFVDMTAHGDVLMLGSAPGEEFRGRDAILKLSLEQMNAMNEEAGISFEALDEDVRYEAYTAGDVGWIVTHMDATYTDGEKQPVRGVAIVVKDGETWKRVFMETSTLVPNREP